MKSRFLPLFLLAAAIALAPALFHTTIACDKHKTDEAAVAKVENTASDSAVAAVATTNEGATPCAKARAAAAVAAANGDAAAPACPHAAAMAANGKAEGEGCGSADCCKKAGEAEAMNVAATGGCPHAKKAGAAVIADASTKAEPAKAERKD